MKRTFSTKLIHPLNPPKNDNRLILRNICPENTQRPLRQFQTETTLLLTLSAWELVKLSSSPKCSNKWTILKYFQRHDWRCLDPRFLPESQRHLKLSQMGWNTDSFKMPSIPIPCKTAAFDEEWGCWKSLYFSFCCFCCLSCYCFKCFRSRCYCLCHHCYRCFIFLSRLASRGIQSCSQG